MLISLLLCSCGSVVDVNKLLAVQRMRIKKQVIKALEKQILAVIIWLFYWI